MGTVTTRELTCIGCPMGCPLIVTMEAGEVISVTGNTCKRGDVYARKEVTNPTRIVTSTVRVSGGDADMVSVKTKEDIPKGKIFECVKALKSVEVPAPVHIGDVLVKDGRSRCGYCGDEKCRIYIKFTTATKYIMDMKYTKYVKICYNGFRFKKIKMER